jgi:hypothetical protein
MFRKHWIGYHEQAIVAGRTARAHHHGFRTQGKEGQVVMVLRQEEVRHLGDLNTTDPQDLGIMDPQDLGTMDLLDLLDLAITDPQDLAIMDHLDIIRFADRALSTLLQSPL